jgi:phospholipid/cholesterol/gamma-HCH transport system ATP-binding protein
MSAIELTELCTAFGAQRVLQGVTLTVAEGETLAVLGRSGTGKSVLLRHLIGLQKPDSGSVKVLGQEVTTLPEAALNALRKRVGFVFQNAALYDSLTVVENVAFPLRYHTTLGAAQRRDQAMALLARVAMEGAADKLPTAISGGMKKRVGLARALALEPELMLYDEPTAGLDPITAEEISALIVELAITSIVVTHDLRGAASIAARVAMLDQGRVVFDGGFQALRQSQDPFVAGFVRAATPAPLALH